MKTRRVPVFFYGTIMDPTDIAKLGVAVNEVVPAKLNGFELRIRPRVNLYPSANSSVYGGLLWLTHEELSTIYSRLTQVYGIEYLPEPVVAEACKPTLQAIAALCYIATEMATGDADPKYVKQLAEIVRTLKHPESYAKHIESFASTDE